jgi:hypothetical protein
MLIILAGIVMFANAGMKALGNGNSTGAIVEFGAIGLCIVLCPIAWLIGDALRKFVMPSAYFATGFSGLLKARLFWMFGPQCAAALSVIGILFLGATDFAEKSAPSANLAPQASTNTQVAANVPDGHINSPATTSSQETSSSEPNAVSVSPSSGDTDNSGSPPTDPEAPLPASSPAGDSAPPTQSPLGVAIQRALQLGQEVPWQDGASGGTVSVGEARMWQGRLCRSYAFTTDGQRSPVEIACQSSGGEWRASAPSSGAASVPQPPQ